MEQRVHKAAIQIWSNNPANYRGITIGNSLGKLLSIILNKRLNYHTGKYHIMNEVQIGFKQNSRTADHVFVLKTIVDKYLETQTHVPVLRGPPKSVY